LFEEIPSRALNLFCVAERIQSFSKSSHLMQDVRLPAEYADTNSGADRALAGLDLLPRAI
jgi:hypothetical protein